MLESLQPDHAVSSMLACKALSNLVAAGHPLSVEKVDTSSLSSLLTSPSTTHCKRHQKVLSLLPALLPAASNNLETALASLLSNLSVISLFRVSCWWQKDCRALHGYNQCEIWLVDWNYSLSKEQSFREETLSLFNSMHFAQTLRVKSIVVWKMGQEQD